MAAPSTTQKLKSAANVGTGSGRKVEKQPSVPGKSQPAHGAGGGGSEEPPHALDVARFRRLNSLIHRENVDVNELLRLVEQDNHVNLMNDPLLSVVIACKKPKLACRLIDKISSNDILKAYNYDGDTALHVAVAMDDKEVALKLIHRVPDLVHKLNVKQEIPLHKAALYGLKDMFWLLVEKNSSPEARREDGATMLHCAIMGNAPVLALQIAKNYKSQIESRNEHALTPLQLLVTIPEAFRSQVVLGALDSFIYDLYPRTRRLEKIKRTHRKALELIEFLARDPRNMEFYVLGRKQGDGGAPAAGFRERGERRDQLNAPAASTRRWNEPPLILGAQMGIPEFVSTILRVCPQAATYLDTGGRSVLQVALKHGNREIVRTIREMTRGKNPILPSWLLSRVDKRTGRTILHFASANAPKHNQDALQMQDELRWFETVRDMVPKELVYSRNAQEMTAEEMFTESHQALLKSCKVQLMETGRMCSGLVAAVVFASSFSIPGDKDPATGNPVFFGRAAFTVFSHAYVIGLSCAATSLVLFLSLAMSPYKEQQFRRIIPTEYFFARSSFGLAMLSFLVAFTCNIYLQLYGWQKTKSKNLIPFVLELTAFPFICFLVLFFRGFTFDLSFLFRSWR
ncbi:hypothetical protein C4D60_Mb02t18800 [Musa balbisiana]|uniref:PGG domain-containing protein n=1 Tax=Musa balbisiana TaxID=52838 RepID=A0A4S8IE34_MUSBA|nr:hypothetical protein C4D60_Mb02t18800 [Musa balbisiana]